MGIYDRDYYREQRRGYGLPLPQTMVGWLIVINVFVYLADGLLSGDSRRLDEHQVAWLLSLRLDDLVHPLYWWRFLTYGFVHNPWPDPWHLLGNMLGLFFLGREIEQQYGRKEFLWLYLTLVVFGGVVWAVGNWLAGGGPGEIVLGASGAVVGIVVLYALNFPRRTLLLWGLLPIPAWLLGVLLVSMDLYGALLNPQGEPVAYGVHLAGATFAFLYYRFRWNLTSLAGRLPSVSTLVKSRPTVRVHDPDDQPQELTEEVDRILEKIHREGEDSLTARERRFMEKASREYQRRRRGPQNTV